MDEAKQAVKVDKEINLKGEVCPYTFVKSKLAMEEMLPGQVLRVIVDHLPATRNVPRSMENEGNEVLEVSELDDSDWQMVIRKRG
ncbi:MAG: sulfurtransferase TusA family protein [Candidatus Hydrogenedentota bacterium]|nr:MAG: sulfurtransferase TusA family protein [Candidatus Hydrogenedentota bacterium]